MNLREHNERQAVLLRELIESERAVISKHLGYDCAESKEGILELRDRISFLISDHVGEEWAKLIREEEEL